MSEWGHVGLHSDNGLDPLFSRFFVELHRPKHIAMIGQGHCGHTFRYAGVENIVESVCTVQETVLTVKMEVDEITHGDTRSSKQLGLSGAGRNGQPQKI